MKLQLSLILSLIMLHSSSSVAMSRSQAVTVSKARIEALVPQFAHLSYTCFIFPKDCRLQGNSQEVLVKLISNELSAVPGVIRYGSGSENFMIDGALRIAKTGSAWGDPIVFNEDLLTVPVGGDEFAPLGFFEVIGVLIHEFGHHQETFMRGNGVPFPRHEELDVIATNVVSYLRDRTRTVTVSSEDVPGLLQQNELRVYNIDIEWFNGVRNVWSHQFVDNGKTVKEVSKDVLQGLRCPKEYRSGHLTFVGTPYYISMQKMRAPQIAVTGGRVEIRQNFGEASVFCVDEQENVFEVFPGYADGVMSLRFERQSDGSLDFKDGGTFLRLTPPDRRY